MGFHDLQENQHDLQRWEWLPVRQPVRMVQQVHHHQSRSWRRYLLYLP